ncbi:M23 family metallopeptidase [Sphingosinicella sp. CPCC 101087]|uniref:M23 family metallopeptidase n=1 Tax=Sphingosinicella sp. CPCC 101087 TaxID=2497754 RepID=UPI001FB0C020|nr:M23 family metallopeptidase [Sphingosinicella sp. CPCC 101087]
MGLVVAITAIVTAVVTSLFWIVAYSIALPGGRMASGDEADSPTSGADLVVGPAGLAVPVAGVRTQDLVDTYSQARAGGARSHDAIDIMAPAGRPVIAAADGMVEKLFFSEGGGGISAYVRSPDRRWIYYYAHLQGYAPGLREGVRVERGDPIGTVGSTGNAAAAGPHLHFAVYRMAPGQDWHEGTPINPYPLLAGEGAAAR